MKPKKNILISPLDWGLGHASRIIPIIKLLLENKYNVVVASSGLQKKLIQSSFPDLSFVDIVKYNIEFSYSNSQILKIFIQTPKIIYKIIKEHKQLKKIIKEYKIDIVISDNRYGFFNKKVKSVFITHQTNIILPEKIKFLQSFINILNTKLINNFDICWIPDFSTDENISGDLSHTNKKIKNQRYIGLLSRFENLNTEKKIDILVILSGPEPQRSIFEKIIEIRLGDTNNNVVIVRGNNKKKNTEFGNIEYIPFANTSQLNKLICQSNIVISRSGYTSIMDFVLLKKKAILVPTPGQTEQEYLASYLSGKRYFVSARQENFNINNLIVKIQDTKIPDFEKIIKNILQDL